MLGILAATGPFPGQSATQAGDGGSIIWPMFLLALFAVVAWKVFKFWRRNRGDDGGYGGGGGDGGWWGRGPRGSAPDPQKPSPTGPDGLLEVPYQWVEAHAKWAKKIVQESHKAKRDV